MKHETYDRQRKANEDRKITTRIGRRKSYRIVTTRGELAEDSFHLNGYISIVIVLVFLLESRIPSQPGSNQPLPVVISFPSLALRVPLAGGSILSLVPFSLHVERGVPGTLFGVHCFVAALHCTQLQKSWVVLLSLKLLILPWVHRARPHTPHTHTDRSKNIGCTFVVRHHRA